MNGFDSWWLDIKLGSRILIKYPGLTIAGVAGIAVAVAIATAGFSVVQVNILGAALPFEEAGRIVAIEVWDTRANAPDARLLHDFGNWREGLRSMREISAYRTLTLNLIAPGAPPESVRVAAMTASGFGVARVSPLLGRYLNEDDERPGAVGALVIGERVWRGRFGADPNILGRTVKLGSAPYAIVGVMPESFGFPVNHRFWIPLSTRAMAGPLTGPPVSVFGRLAPGETLESAQAEVAAARDRAAATSPPVYGPLRYGVKPYPVSVLKLGAPGEMAALFAMQGTAVALLVLVCLNTAILVYTRTAMRQAEIGLRTALGASRGRIVAQLFLEALVLSAVAASAGLGLAAFALRQVTAASRNVSADLPFWLSFRLSPEAVLFGAALGILAAAIVGVIPGLQATASRAQSGLRIVGAGGSSLRMGRIWSVLIAAQVAFAVGLLPAAILHAQRNLPHTLAGPGFPAERYLSASLGLEHVADGRASDPARFAIRQEELMRRLAADPSVAAVTFAASGPGDERGARIEAEGAAGVIHEVLPNRVAATFLETFDVPLLAGRRLEPGDVRSVVVNQPLAERLFGGNALGRRFRYVSGRGEEPGTWHEVVGVVTNFPSGVSAAMRDSQLRVYHLAAPGQLQPAVLAMRTRTGGASFGQRLREITAAVDPDLVLSDVRGLDEVLRREQWIVRLEASSMLAVTVSVLLLCSAGIHALMSFTVSQRRREIGIRMALGATQTSIVISVLSRGLRQIGAGAALGAVLCLLFSRLFVEESEGIAVALLAMVAAVLSVGFFAARGPTRRSLRAQPTEVLREQ